MAPNNEKLKTVDVFVAGSITLKQERQAIRDLFMSINNAVAGLMFFYVKAFDDFGASSQQHNYDDYIRKADYVIFLIDQEKGSGQHTLGEFQLALKAQKLNEQNKPEILVFYRQIHELIPHPEFIQVCNDCRHYYSLYSDVENLRSQLLYKMFIDVIKTQNQRIKELLELADADIKEGSDFNTKSDKVIPVSGEVEPIPTYAEDLNPSITDEEDVEQTESSKYVVVEAVKKLHASLINATKSILTMVQDLADTGDLSFPKQVAAVAELKDNMQTSAFVLPKSVYAEVESFAVNYPQKGYNIVLNALRELVSNGATSLDVAALEAMHAELLKAMPVDETQDQLNALIRNLQDYCNVLDD
jgi:hypothetical protein